MCLDLEPVTYRVREMPAGNSNTFSSLHNKLSAAAIARPQQEAEPVQLRTYLESDKSEIRINGGQKRTLDSEITAEDELHSTSKRPRISTLPIPTAVSPGLFTVKAHLPPQDACAEGDSAQEIFSSDPSELFSCVSQASSSNHAAIRVIASPHVSTSLPSSSPNSISLISSSASTSSTSSSLPVITKAITTSAGSSVQFPYVHISCPSAKQQTVTRSHLINSNPSVTSSLNLGHGLLVNTLNSTNQVKPQVVAVAPGPLHTGQMVSSSITGTTSSILPPLLSGSGVNVGTHKFVLTSPGSQTILAQPGAGPGTALLLAAGAAAGNHRILVRHPTPTSSVAHQQLKQSKANQQAAVPTAFRSLLAQNPSVNPPSVITRPTEVKVSRQLFHDATQSLSTSSKTVSLLTNGKVSVSSPTVTAPSGTVSPGSSTLVLEANSIADNHIVVDREFLPSSKSVSNVPDKNKSKLSCNKTLETPPSGQQFETSPNKSGSANSHAGIRSTVGASPISDMDVMGLELPVEEGLGSTLGPTPTDSFNDSFASTSSSVVTTMVAGTHFLNHSQVGSVADSLLASHKPNGDIFVVSNTKTASTSSPGDPTHSSLSSSPSPNGNNSASLLVNNSMKPGGFSSIKASMNHAGTENAVVSNGSLFTSQSLKSENTSLDTGLSELQFSDHVEDLSQEAAPGQFINGHITSTDHPADINSELENVATVLSEDIPVNNHLNEVTMEEEMEQEVDTNTDILASTDSTQQLLLSEGTNIYQTDEGIFIHSSNGNTYQLQGAQGLSLETVQALLSGTLDTWAS